MLRIGILGSGSKANEHIALIKGIVGCELSGIFTGNNHDENTNSSLNELKIYSNYEEFLCSCDVIDLTNYICDQFNLLSEAVRKSKHLFIDNFSSFSVDQAFQLSKLAEEANLKVQINHVERFNPAFLAAQSHFKNPLFVETHRLTSFKPEDSNKPVVLQLMILDIDILLNTIKSNVKKISACGVAILSNTYDIANARIEFDNGCVANLTASRISPSEMQKSRFFQKDAYITVDFLNHKTDLLKINSSEDSEISEQGNVIPMGNGKDVIIQNMVIRNNNALLEELTTFCECVIHDINPPVSLYDGYKTLLVADQILEKIKVNSNC